MLDLSAGASRLLYQASLPERSTQPGGVGPVRIEPSEGSARSTTRLLCCALVLGLLDAGVSHAGSIVPSPFEQAQQLLLSDGLTEAARFTSLLNTAADQNDPRAEYDLGYCYEHGIGVPVDRDHALALYRRAIADADTDDLRGIAAIGANHVSARLDHPPAPAAPSAGGPVATDVVAALLTYGSAMLRNGNVGAARTLFERAADAGRSAAAIAAGKTYDPRFLAEIGATDVTPNPALAAGWYRRAVLLGDAEGDRLLIGLGAVAEQAADGQPKLLQTADRKSSN